MNNTICFKVLMASNSKCCCIVYTCICLLWFLSNKIFLLYVYLQNGKNKRRKKKAGTTLLNFLSMYFVQNNKETQFSFENNGCKLKEYSKNNAQTQFSVSEFLPVSAPAYYNFSGPSGNLSIGIAKILFYLIYKILSFILNFVIWNFFQSKNSVAKNVSSTLANVLESFSCCFEQLFCRKTLTTCLWRKKLHSACYLRSFKNKQDLKLQFAVYKFLIRNPSEITSWDFSVSFKVPFRNIT